MASKDGTPTIHDMAHASNVSVMAVYGSLNELEKVASDTLEGIRKAIEELGYQQGLVARSLVRRITKTTGVIMPDIKNTFFITWLLFLEEYTIRYQFFQVLDVRETHADR